MAYRVVQWGTGAVGVEAIRGILDHPDLELVGAKVYSETKSGVDAGVLAGRPLHEHVRSASVATAMQAVNAIGPVCRAAAGFVTMADLPLHLYR